MIAKIRELREKKANLVTQSRALLTTVETESRSMTTEEKTKYDRIFADIHECTDHITRLERQLEAEREIAGTVADQTRMGQAAGEPSEQRIQELRAQAQIQHRSRLAAFLDRLSGIVQPGHDGRDIHLSQPGAEVRASLEYQEAFDAYLRNGRDGITPEQRTVLHHRSLQADSNILGGYLLAPMQMVMTLIKAVDDLVFIRPLATKFTIGQADSLGAPSLDTDPADWDWTTELATATADTSTRFGRRELKPSPLAKLIKISNKLLAKAVMSAESIVLQRLAYKFAITEEKHFLTGTGAAQPLGVFTASDQGIATSRDVSTDNATDSPTADGLVNAKYALKAPYWPAARWMFHRDCVSKIAKLKTGDGQYLWQPGITMGAQDRLLGFPILMSEHVPNTFSTGLYVGILGDFSHYWIADSINLQIQRLVELYAESNQTGFIGRAELDAMPVLGEAFVRVKLA